jgi:hypothetical protein
LIDRLGSAPWRIASEVGDGSKFKRRPIRD